jgi:Holliday junction resolvase
VRDYLRLRGWFVIRIQQGIGCHKGISDLIALRWGDVCFIEIKSPKGKQSDNQIKFECDIKNSGGNYFLVDNIDKIINDPYWS